MPYLGALAFLVCGQQGVDPAAVVRSLEAERNTRISEAIKSGKTADFEKIDRGIIEKAIAKLSGVRPEKIADKEALNWAGLYTVAKKHREARALIERYLRL